MLKELFKNILMFLGRSAALLAPLRFDGQTVFFFSTYHMGGAEKVHINILKALKELPKVCFFTTRSFDQAQKGAFYDLGPCHDVNFFTTGIIRYAALGYFSDIINASRDVSVFLATSAFSYQLVPFLRETVPVYDLIHAMKTEPAAMGLAIAERVAGRIFISPSVANDMIKQYRAGNISREADNKIITMINYVDVPPGAAVRDNTETKNILFVGRFVPVKRPDIFARTALILKEKHGDMTFSMVGGYSRYAPDSKLFGACRLYGEINDRERLFNIYRDHQVLVLTSTLEGFPLVIMEAMAMGLVVISTDVGGISDHIRHGENGFLVKVANDQELVDEFVKLIEYLKNDPSICRKVSDNAREYAARTFSKEAFDNKVRSIFGLKSAPPEKNREASIILPTYNGSKYIRRSIDSCLKQSYHDIELIIVDDASTDGTPSIISSYKDGRIRYLRHEANKNLPAALNTGFAASTGGYLTWTSDDNYYHPQAIEKMVSFLEEGRDFVYSDSYAFNEDDEASRIVEEREPVFVPERNTRIGACFLYTRKVMETVGEYDTEAFLAEDYDYWIRVSKSFKMHYLKEPLYYYRIHDGSLFVSRYYEVRIVAALVKVKNNILNIPGLTRLLISQCMNRFIKDRHSAPLNVFKRVFVKLYEYYLFAAAGAGL